MQLTWSEAFHYAFLSGGYVFPLISGLVLIAAVIILIAKWNSGKWDDINPILKSAILFVLLSFGVYLTYNKPGEIKNKNEGLILPDGFSEHFEQNRKAVLDSMFYNNALIGAPYKK